MTLVKIQTMIKLLIIIILSLFLSCISSDNSINAPIKEYPFIYNQTTGICTQIKDNNSIINIRYHENSDKAKLKLFLALKWHILSPNSNANDSSRIVIIGKLYDEIKLTKQCGKCADTQKYQEFELVNWYLKTPFKQLTYNGKPPEQLIDNPDLIQIIERQSLKSEDFNAFEGLLKLDLNKHILQVPNKP